MSNKYGNHAVVVDNIRFASAKEARRYGELRLLERAGEITDLQVQPEFELATHGAVLALERYRDALETWLMVMELERDAKRFRWEVPA